MEKTKIQTIDIKGKKYATVKATLFLDLDHGFVCTYYYVYDGG